MHKRYLPGIFLVSALLLTTVQACKKESTLGIDNDKVIKTPFSLYAADIDGSLYVSNDGQDYRNIFPADGYPASLILSSDTNLLFVKQNLHLSSNSGRNFNPVYLNVNHFPWQSMAYNFKNHNRVYIASKLGKGVAYSNDNGKSWQTDTAWDANVPPSFLISSFAGLTDKNSLFCFSNKNNVLFKKDGENANWTAITAQGFFPVSGTEFYLVSNESTLFLVDYNGKGGVWYSQDEGVNWVQFGQGALPKNKHWNCAISNQGGTSLIVGTENAGAYQIENNSFVSALGGLEIATSVYSIAAHSNTFKNESVKPYVFIGTNRGIYRSEDNGRNWDRVTYGVLDKKMVAVY